MLDYLSMCDVYTYITICRYVKHLGEREREREKEKKKKKKKKKKKEREREKIELLKYGSCRFPYMSSLFKLSIQGVRSFDSERQEAIQFGFPLTLICGQNGCGKTTIIECLKYATTGDLPPNSKGGAFVNDPSIATRNSVTAQVKLAFVNANGKSMITTRTMQLTRRKNRTGLSTSTFKTLDGQLAVIDRGEKITKSSKNSELDSSIPLYLGASRAILDNVIFCHQDDSLWPLSEASVLKKRFDDIFEALKFAKVLDNLKTIHRDMNTDIKLIEQSVNHLKIDRERAKKINERKDRLEENIQNFSYVITTLTAAIEEKEREAEVLFHSHQMFQETLSKYEQLQFTESSVGEQVNRLEKTIDKLTESDQLLLQHLNNYDSFSTEYEKEILALDEAKERACDDLKAKRDQLNNKLREEGSIKAKEERFNENRFKMITVFQNIKHLFVLNDFETDVITNLDTCKNLVDVHYDKLLSSFEEGTKRIRESESALDGDIRLLENHLQRENSIIQQNKEDIGKEIKKMDSIKAEKESIEFNEDILSNHRAELENMIQKYNVLKDTSKLNEKDEEIKYCKDRLSILEDESEELDKKFSETHEQTNLFARRDVIKETRKENKENISALVATYADKFKSDVGIEMNIESFEEQLHLRTKSLNETLKNEEKTMNKMKMEKDSLEIEKKNLISSTKEFEKKLEELQFIITQKIDEKEICEYEKIVEELEEDYQNTLEALNTFEVTRQFKIKSIEIAERRGHCTLCLRTFESDGLKAFLTMLRDDVQNMNISQLKENTDVSKNDLEAMKDINKEILTYRDVLQNFRSSKNQISQLDSEILNKEKGLKTFEEHVSNARHQMEFHKNLCLDMADITRLKINIATADKQMEVIEEQLQNIGLPSLSSKEVKDNYGKLKKEIKDLRMSLQDKIEIKFSTQQNIAASESNIKQKKLAIGELELISQRQRSLDDTMSATAALIKDREDRVSRLKERAEDLDKKRKGLETDLKNLRVENARSFRKENENLDVAKKKVEIFRECVDIHHKLLEDKTPSLELLIASLHHLEGEIETLENEIKRSELRIKKCEKHMSESVNRKSNIRDNIEYRALQKEREELNAQMNTLDVKEAQAKKNDYQKESSILRKELTNLNSEHAGKIGEIRQMRDQIGSLKEELSNEYQGTNEDYHKEWIKLQTNLLMSSDIQNYSKALDSAIMKYHSMKMDDINRILEELWRLTYKGTDIDTISIKSDENLQAKGNRMYNYRVVMYKQDSELDMRGRCSAGQKVLASILIRLALAECFGSNCGMIALDEPTTNLDLDNSESLAHALNRVIDFRRSQKNFQLIVITHDEKFLSHINGDSFTDHFYRVQRDECQKSIIRRLPINVIHGE